MKKHLVLGSILFAAISAFPQSNSKIKPSGIINNAELISQRFAMQNRTEEPVSSGQSAAQLPASLEEPVNGANGKTQSATTFTTNWNSFTGSLNGYGGLVSSSKPLQYNDELNAISFIHRKSATYSMSPQQTVVGAISGGVVAMISQNCGNSWDSTLIWNNSTQWARYPQGGIYNPTGNKDINNAYIVASGPVTPAAGGWIGNFFASKKLGTYDNIASTVPGAQQFIANSGTFTGLDKVDFARLDFSVTDDGVVHAIGMIADDASSTTNIGFRGSRVIKGTFSSGTFVWTGDSIIPNVTAGGGTKDVVSTSYMAWNEAGTVGYVFNIGCRANPTNSVNSGFQPIVVKTTDGGATWVPINGIDFTQPSFVAPVMDHLLSTRSNTNIAIPYFNTGEGISAVVDKNDDLHIVSSLLSTSTSHPDSLNYIFTFNNADGETYYYPHLPGLRPYLYDFIGGSNPAAPWKVVLIDSLATEAPGGAASSNGYGSNLWLPDAAGAKIVSDARIQASRTPDGKYVVYTYAESDTAVTLVKWNQVPNVKARLYDVTAGTVHPNEINITRPTTPSQRNVNVSSRAYFHYAAPTCALAQTIAVGNNGPAISLPMVVTNNSNLDGAAPVTHRFSYAALNFGNVAEADIYQLCPSATPPTTVSTIGFAENNLNVENSFIYPNPTSNSAILSIDLKNNSTVNVSVMNMVGQVVKTSSNSSQVGRNNITIDLTGLSKGVYMTTVNVDGATSTKKLIIE